MIESNDAIFDTSPSEAPWSVWQTEVLQVIQTEFRGVLEDVSSEDIDWSAWRPLYDQGCSAREAVRSAFGRVA